MICLCNIAESHSSTIMVTSAGVALPDIPADFIKLSNWNVDDDEVFALKTGGAVARLEDALLEVFWGFDGVFAHQLFTGGETDYIPIKSLSDISLRCRPTQEVRIKYSYFIKENK